MAGDDSRYLEGWEEEELRFMLCFVTKILKINPDFVTKKV